MTQKIVFAALVLWVSTPVLASHTICSFESAQASRYDELEFIGDGDGKPMIVFSSTALGSGERVRLQSADYTLKHFIPREAAVHLAYRNPGSPAWPASFTLTARNGRATLQIGPVAEGGIFRCAD